MSAPWEDFATPGAAPVESGPWDDFSEPWKDFEEAAPPQASFEESFNPSARFLPDMQATTRGGPPLSLPSGAFQSTMGEISEAMDAALSPSTMLEAATFPGRVAYAGAADLVSQIPSSEYIGPGPEDYVVTDRNREFGGNLKALFATGEPLPVETFLAEVSKTNPKLAVAGKVGKDLAAMSPLAALGFLPSALAKLAAAGFSVDMIAHAPEQFQDYAEEINKPKEEQDPDKLTTLQAGILQTFAFAPLAGKHGASAVPKGPLNPVFDPVSGFSPREPLQRAAEAEFIAGDRPQSVTAELPVNAPKVSVSAEPLKEAAPLPPEATAQKIPDLLEGERLVTVVRPDGTTYPAAFADKFYDMTSKGMGKIPAVAKIVNGGWSHGAVKAGEKIVEIESAKPEAPLNPGGALKDLSPELQARSNAVKDSMAAEFDRLKAEVEPTPPAAAKEPWEMTREQYIAANAGERPRAGIYNEREEAIWNKNRAKFVARHNAQVELAVKQGKPVPTEVLAEYPDLAKPAPEAAKVEKQYEEKPTSTVGTAERQVGEVQTPIPREKESLLGDKVEPTPAAPVAAVKINGKFQLPSQGPQTFSVLEKLEQTASEKTNGEQIVRVKNDRTGKEEIVLESELRPVKPGVPGVGIKRRTVEDLNAALRKEGMDPSVFPDATSKKNALERAIAKIEEAQAKLRGSRTTLSMGVPKAILDVALETVRLSLKAGNSMAKAIAAAVAHIRKEMGEGKFDELEVRNYIADRMLEKPQGIALTDKVEMRTLSERATTSEKVPEPVQEQIQTSPESFYQVQSLKGVEQSSKAKSDAELGATSKDSDAYTADKLELSTRLLNAGKHEEGYRVFQDLSADLTRMGQVINQAKLFQALRPEHVVTVLNKELVKGGRDPLTLEQSARVEAAAQGRITKQLELERATDEWVKNPTDANAAKAETALSDANKAAVAEQSLVNQFKPRTLASILKAILQGNMLAPISEVANLVGNMSFIPLRAGSRVPATAIDMLDSAIRNRPRQMSVAPIGGTKAAIAGLIQGAKQIPSILIRGTGETIKGEPRAGLHPMRAWVKQFAKNPDVPTVGGKIPFSERLNLLIEGTFGVPAEIMLRGLGAGDAPFRGAARGRLIAEAARLQKLKPSDQRMAQRFPELFFDKATLERIDSEGRAAIFQRHSSTIDRIMELARSRGDLMDFAIATVAPYKLTPWNIVGEILSYNPLIATARSGIEARRGNVRAAEMNAGKALVGGMTIYAGYWLYENGLLSPSLDSRDEQQKARMLAGEVMPPNHINVSGLKRKLAGGDPEFKSGDETVDIFRGGGLAGSLFYMVANIGRDAETSPPGDEMLLSVLKNSTLEQARFGVNQSFLKGVTGLLDAVRYGETDNYIQSYAGTILSIPLPNTLSALSRAQRQYKVDASDPKFKKQLENLVRTRLGFAGLDDYLPLKRGLWGEPLPETPTNANALVYHFFDISKNKQVTSDPVPLELYRLWRKTASSSVIPTPPEKTITADRETRVLTPAQHSRYAELVGSARRDIVGRVVANPEWHQIPDEGKMNILEKVYRAGLERGKEEFMIEAWDKLEAKPAKAGFK